MTDAGGADPTDSLLLMTLGDAPERACARSSAALPDVSVIDGSPDYITTERSVSSFLTEVFYSGITGSYFAVITHDNSTW